MSVQTFHPSPVDQSATNWAVAARIVSAFAPHAQTTPDMTVVLDAGALFNGTVLTEMLAQNTATITAPTTNLRIDRIVVDSTTGAVSIVTGTEASSPTAPAIPLGKLPVARVVLSPSTTAITNDLITDERVLLDQTPNGSPVICLATLGGSNQPIAASTQAKVQLNTAEINVGNAFDTTSKWFKPAIAGYYAISAQVCIGLPADKVAGVMIYKNGTVVAYAQMWDAWGSASHTFATCNTIVQLNDNDYVEVYAYHTAASTQTLLGTSTQSYFTAYRIG